MSHQLLLPFVFSPYPLLLTTSADSASYLVLNFYRYTTALSPEPSATASTPAAAAAAVGV